MKLSKLWQILAVTSPLIFLFPSVGLTATYTEAAVSNGGSIKGKVTFKGALPKDAIDKIAITKNPDVCGKGYREVVWIDVKGGALRGSFVYIEDITKGKKWAAPKGGKYMIEQKGCRFRPWAQVIKQGSIIIRHSDGKGVLHNINTREMIGVERGRVIKRTIFNFGQPDPGDIIKNLRTRRSQFIAINCEAHNFMFGFMMAPKHPYAVVVKADGTYSISNIPPGKYTVVAWHPRLGLKKTQVTIKAKGLAKANFTFSK